MARAKTGRPPNVSKTVRGQLSAILDGGESNKGVLAVSVTLLFKKCVSPKQDIRRHRAEQAGGFSGRGLDTKVVTPFMKRNGFPAMASGSGWLTRSLEQSAPYGLDYPGKITPKELKSAFLGLLDEVQSGRANARNCLVCLLAGLIERRRAADDFKFHTPKGLAISEIVACLCAHFSTRGRGASRLPTLAIHAVYQRLVAEVSRYAGCTLEPLESHQSADGKTRMLGDVQVTGADGAPMEAVEIKHGLPLTAEMVRACRAKFRWSRMPTFYLLSTSSRVDGAEDIKAEIADIREKHGCEMIVNGIAPTIKYYLRLLTDTNKFVEAYVAHLDADAGVSQNLKERWNTLTEKHPAPARNSPHD